MGGSEHPQFWVKDTRKVSRVRHVIGSYTVSDESKRKDRKGRGRSIGPRVGKRGERREMGDHR